METLILEHSFLSLGTVSLANFSGLVVLIERGGWVMWPLLACSVLAFAVIVERILVFGIFSIQTRRMRRKVEQMLDALLRGDLDFALRVGHQAGPLGQFLVHGLEHRASGLTEALEESGQQVLERLRRGLSILDTLVTLSPMLGILGTVTGIIASFQLLGTATVGTDPVAISGGIAEALITTVAGLVVSMVALIPLNAFRSQVRRWARVLEHVGRHCEHAYAKGVKDAS